MSKKQKKELELAVQNALYGKLVVITDIPKIYRDAEELVGRGVALNEAAEQATAKYDIAAGVKR